MKTLARVLSVLMVFLMLSGAASEHRAQADAGKPGIDVVIVLDASLSLCYDRDAFDYERTCLDAAVMMINMCDAQYSRVAVVPFIYKTVAGEYWNRWVDVSDFNQRNALCSAVLGHVKEAERHGYTNYNDAMTSARELIRSSQESGNKPMVLVLGDSNQNGNPENGYELNDAAAIQAENEKTVALANEIKGMGGTIYCLDVGSYNLTEGEPLLYQIAGVNDTHIDKNAYYWDDIQEGELKKRFSNVFADMIGSRQKELSAHISEEKQIDLELYVPNNSVSEINVVIERSKIASYDSLKVYSPDGYEIGIGNRLRVYGTDKGGQNGYDFVSLKLIDPEDGTWTIKADKSPQITGNDSLMYDLLYNYELELESGLTSGTDYLKTDNISFEAFFVKPGNIVSDDAALYKGRDAQGNGIISWVSIYNSSYVEVARLDLTPNAGELRFEGTIPVNELGKMSAGSNTFTFKVFAEGDNLVRESVGGSFTVMDTCPTLIGEPTLTTDKILVDQVDGQADQVSRVALADRFEDQDNDVLQYVIQNAEGVQATIEGSDLVISRLIGAASGKGVVQVCAQDAAGQNSEALTVYTDVISVYELFDRYVQVRLNSDEVEAVDGTMNLGKNSMVSLHTEYIVTGDSDMFPCNYLDEEMLAMMKAQEMVVYQTTDLAEQSGTSFDAATHEIKSGIQETQFVVTAQVTLAGRVKEAERLNVKVQNSLPTIAVGLTDALIVGGAVIGEDGMPEFTVDKDNPEAHADALNIDLKQWFSDADAQDNASLKYSVGVTAGANPVESALYSVPRQMLTLIGVISDNGDVLNVNENGAQLTIDPVRFGSMMLTVTATDSDGAETSFAVRYFIVSSRDRLFCLVTDILAAALLILLIAVLFNKLVIHQKWSKGLYVSMTDENGFALTNFEGEESILFEHGGKQSITLSVIASGFDGISEEVNSVLDAVKVWPTMGKQLVLVLPKGSLGFKLKIGDKVVKNGTKWKVNDALKIIDEGGDEEHTVASITFSIK